MELPLGSAVDGPPTSRERQASELEELQLSAQFKARRSPFSVHDPVLYNLSPKQKGLLREIEYKDFKRRRQVFPGLPERQVDYRSQLEE